MAQKEPKKQPAGSPRADAVKRILSIAKLVRQRGTPEQAEEAVEWEKLLVRRVEELEKSSLSQAA